MGRGKPGWSRIEIAAVFPAGGLRRAIVELDLRAVPNRPVAAARALARLEHCTGITGLAHLVCRNQARNATAQDNYFRALSGTAFHCQRHCARLWYSHQSQM